MYICIQIYHIIYIYYITMPCSSLVLMTGEWYGGGGASQAILPHWGWDEYLSRTCRFNV